MKSDFAALFRGVEEIIVGEDLEKALNSTQKLRIKFGVDPSRPDIHLGHAVPLKVLRRLQDLGHTIIFLIGDATARIGDPSGRNKTRPVLTDAEIKANAKTYLDQVEKILDVGKAEVRYNSEWLDKLTFAELIKLAGNFTVAQLIEREDFKTRLEAGQELSLHELLYPVMQAYDSVMLKADVEFGGTDQRFNNLAGRDLQKKMGQKPQQVVLTKLLIGTDGSQKMSKSLNNYIGITDAPADMYGKVMSINDELIAPYYELCTDIELSVIEELVKTLAEGANPRDSKASLAREIVRIYHGEAPALKAEESWNTTFRDKGGPSADQIEEIIYAGDQSLLIDLLVAVDLIASKSEGRRLVRDKGLRVNNIVVEDEDARVANGDLINIGKKRFYRLKQK
jgi:tyrosyl-tRNA synthetase